MKGTPKKKNTLRAKTQKKKKTAMWGCLTCFSIIIIIIIIIIKPIVALKKWVSGRVILFCNKCFR